MNGIVLIDKGIGVTSRSVDNKIQRLFHIKKVGHLGTLDPFASGLLVIAIDKGCKFLPYLDDSFKSYEATLILGKKTSSGDCTGEVIEEKPVPSLDEETIIKVLDSFLGESEQIPPMTSALHHDGKRLYDLSRKGIEVERKPRKIFIKALKLDYFAENCIKFSVTCSRGTYVRVLGEDIANKLGTLGYLKDLRRTKVGNISVEDTVKVEDLNEHSIINPTKYMDYPIVKVDKDNPIVKDIKNGKKIQIATSFDSPLICYYDNENKGFVALAIYQREEDDIFSCQRGLW